MSSVCYVYSRPRCARSAVPRAARGAGGTLGTLGTLGMAPERAARARRTLDTRRCAPGALRAHVEGWAP